MDKLKEWDALEAVAGTEHDHLLDTPAIWHSDPKGVAHGRADHGSTSHAGTLRDLLSLTRHTKGCCTVHAVAGEAGKHAAQRAQDVTASSALIARLNTLLETSPSETYRKALGELSSGSDRNATETAQLEHLCQRAKAHAQSHAERDRLENTWLERAARRHPDSPIATIGRLLDGNIRIHTWHVRNSLMHTEMTQTWTSELTDMLMKTTPDGLDVLDELELDEILEYTKDGTALKDAIVAAWHAKACDAAQRAADWTHDWIQARKQHQVHALCITDASTWQYVAPDVHAAWSRRDLDDIALVVPLGVAEGLAIALSGTSPHQASDLAWCPLARALTDSELDVIDQLAKDQNGRVESASELIAIASALT